MSDIVDRLRTRNGRPDGFGLGPVCDEAADIIERLRTVMVAAAEEIAAHWDAHCDAEGYGPANLQRRLEEGIPSQYGYTAGAFAELKAENERLRAAIAAPQPAPARVPAPDVLIGAMFQHQQEDNEASMAFDFSDYRSGFRAAERAHGIGTPEKEAP